jgi:hypothetical protein
MMRRSLIEVILGSTLLAGSCCFAGCKQAEVKPVKYQMPDTAARASSMNWIAEDFVKLALAVGQHDPLYVDAYFGPEAWRTAAQREQKPLASIEQDAKRLIAELQGLDVTGEEEMIRLRKQFLAKQIESLAARVRMLEGAKLSFDEESRALYDAAAPHHDESYFRERLARIDSLLPPGDGSLAERLERYRRDFIIPKEKLDTVFTAAIEEARRRTKRHIALPADESFDVEYVTDKPWGAYNWYKGDYRSVIQINMDLPKYIDQAVGLVCHEGYPGHHVQNVLVEMHLVKERGWIEFTVSPLFSPLSPINEGSANFGVEMAFPGNDRLAFEREVLYPLAGLDTARAQSYATLQKLTRELSYAQNEAARRYLNGEITAEAAAQWLSDFALMSPARARKLVTFFDQYRSYVINYNVGYDLVKDYIEKRGGTADQPEKRWAEFGALISSPRISSALR